MIMRWLGFDVRRHLDCMHDRVDALTAWIKGF